MSSYFQSFGEIYKIQITAKTSFTIGEVDFFDAESVFKVLSEKTHQLDGKEVNVWTDINDHELAANLRQANYANRKCNSDRPTNAETSILCLIDHCLIEIFSRLQPLDLMSISETCKRFQTVAPLATFSALSSMDFGELYTDAKLDEFVKVLTNYGRFITDLTVEVNAFTFRKNASAALIAIADYCTGTLKSLNLLGFEIERKLRPRYRFKHDEHEKNDEHIAKIQTLFSTLESIAFKNGALDPRILSECEHLVHLELVDMDYFDAEAFDYSYPQLKSVTLRNINVHGRQSQLATFFKNHPYLEKIVIERLAVRVSFWDEKSVLLVDPLINHFGDNLQLLQMVGFQIRDEMVRRFQPILKSLKYLKLRRFGRKLTVCLFPDENQLKEIDIVPFCRTNAMEMVFPKLESLKLDFSQEKVSADILNKFLENQTSLKEIVVRGIARKHLFRFQAILLFIVNNLKNVMKVKLQLNELNHQLITFDAFDCITKLKIRFFMVRNETEMYKNGRVYVDGFDIGEELGDFIVKFPNVRQFDLVGSIAYDVPEGPFVVLKHLLDKLWHIRAVNITVEKLLLEDKANGELMKMAEQNNQKLNIFYPGYLPPGSMFEMEMDRRVLLDNQK